MQLGKAVEVSCRHVLRMLDTESAVTLPVGFHDFAVEIEDDRNALVPNGVSTNLQARDIRSHHAILHQGNWMHFVREQPVIVGLIGERVEEISCGGAKGTVRVGFESTDAEKRTTKGVPDANFYLIIDAGDEGGSIDARG